jgi:hypothetical protein
MFQVMDIFILYYSLMTLKYCYAQIIGYLV